MLLNIHEITYVDKTFKTISSQLIKINIFYNYLHQTEDTL